MSRIAGLADVHAMHLSKALQVIDHELRTPHAEDASIVADVLSSNCLPPRSGAVFYEQPEEWKEETKLQAELAARVHPASLARCMTTGISVELKHKAHGLYQAEITHSDSRNSIERLWPNNGPLSDDLQLKSTAGPSTDGSSSRTSTSSADPFNPWSSFDPLLAEYEELMSSGRLGAMGLSITEASSALGLHGAQRHHHHRSQTQPLPQPHSPRASHQDQLQVRTASSSSSKHRLVSSRMRRHSALDLNHGVLKPTALTAAHPGPASEPPAPGIGISSTSEAAGAGVVTTTSTGRFRRHSTMDICSQPGTAAAGMAPLAAHAASSSSCATTTPSARRASLFLPHTASSLLVGHASGTDLTSPGLSAATAPSSSPAAAAATAPVLAAGAAAAGAVGAAPFIAAGSPTAAALALSAGRRTRSTIHLDQTPGTLSPSHSPTGSPSTSGHLAKVNFIGPASYSTPKTDGLLSRLRGGGGCNHSKSMGPRSAVLYQQQ